MKWNFLVLKNLIKLSTVNKTPLGETDCFSNLYYLLAAQVSSFLIHNHFPKNTSQTPLVPYHLCDLPALGKRRISLGVENFLVSQGCASAHILILLGTSLIKNSKSISNYVKIINLFTNGEGINKLEV